MGRKIRAFHNYDSKIGIGQTIDLESDESLHLSKVLRIGKDFEVEVLNGCGQVIQAKCVDLQMRRVRVEVLSSKSFSMLLPAVRLGVAMTKKSKWEEIIRPLTELGVDRITPLLTERTEVRSKEIQYDSKIKKWRKLAIEACKQSGNPWLPKIEGPLELEKFLEASGQMDELWMGSLRPDAVKLKPSTNAKTLAILIGPEGGWTANEEERTARSGGKLFSLSPYTLRVENGAVSALAVARSAYLL